MEIKPSCNLDSGQGLKLELQETPMCCQISQIHIKWDSFIFATSFILCVPMLLVLLPINHYILQNIVKCAEEEIALGLTVQSQLSHTRRRLRGDRQCPFLPIPQRLTHEHPLPQWVYVSLSFPTWAKQHLTVVCSL